MQKTVIIGAGPAGLAMAGRLRHAGLEFEILEASDRISNSWENHYERLHLHTIKSYSALPYYDFPSSYPEYVPRKLLLEYYSQYARKFKIKPRFGARVDKIVRSGDQWSITINAGETLQADAVVVATGFNRKPVVPEWPGQDRFEGSIVHSRAYRNADPYRSQQVLVVGMGNTGAEIALDLAEQGCQSAIAVRSPVNVVPRDFWGRPTQLTAMTLNKLPDIIGDQIGILLQKLTVGDLSAYGLKKAPYPPAVQLRKFGKTPVIDVGTLSKIKSGEIAIKPGISKFCGNEIEFTDGSKRHFDAVILATGYHCAVEEFVENTEHLLNTQRVPRAIWYSQSPGLYFLGFDAYSSGLLYTINKDSAKILDRIMQPSI